MCGAQIYEIIKISNTKFRFICGCIYLIFLGYLFHLINIKSVLDMLRFKTTNFPFKFYPINYWPKGGPIYPIRLLGFNWTKIAVFEKEKYPSCGIFFWF